MFKKTVATILALLMALGCVSATAETGKQEKVYVVAGADGTVISITDNVRLENGDGLDVIEDRTLLTDIENLSGKEAFSLDGNTLTWQAGGKDIIYQGTSDKAPALVPVVTITLDGETVSAAELKDREGEAVMTVTYHVNEKVPAVAVTVMLLPETGVSDLKTENAFVITEMGRQILAGYAVPGANALLKLPASFTVSFHADHAELGWMMTIVTSEPIRMICEAAEEKTDIDLHAELEEIKTVVSAMSRNATIPETNGATKELVQRLNELNSGLISQDDGAKQLADGAKQLYGSDASAEDGTAGEASGTIALADGAAALDNGLATLAQNNEALNHGAEAILEAVLETANAQIAASDLAKAGISIPELTAENYAQVLDATIAQLDPETLKGAVSSASDETVQAKLAEARKAADSLMALKAQLDQVNAFATGLKEYTDGVAQAADGAAKLNAGAAELKDGAALLAQGADNLYTNGTQILKASILKAEAELAQKLLPISTLVLPEALKEYEQTRELTQNTHYDLVPEGIRTTTLYLIRTDL